MTVAITFLVETFFAFWTGKRLKLQMIPNVIVHIPDSGRLNFVAEEAKQGLPIPPRLRIDLPHYGIICAQIAIELLWVWCCELI